MLRAKPHNAPQVSEVVNTRERNVSTSSTHATAGSNYNPANVNYMEDVNNAPSALRSR